MRLPGGNKSSRRIGLYKPNRRIFGVLIDFSRELIGYNIPFLPLFSTDFPVAAWPVL
jgi:hypothetical protein